MSQYKDYGYHTDAPFEAHQYILPAVLSELAKLECRKILDVGCGNGSLTTQLVKEGYDVYGIDASEQGITIARTRDEARFFLHDVTSDQLPDPIQNLRFDTIISVEVIEHLYDPGGFIDFCRNILSHSGGMGNLVLTTPYHGYLKNLAIAATGQFDRHVTALWDGGHIKFWSRRTLSELLVRHGFEVLHFKGAGRLPYLWKSMIISARLRK